MSVNTKMTAIADEIRTLSGTTEAMGLDAMATNVGNANSEIDSQADLLLQIVTALEGKTAAGGGSGGGVCTVEIMADGPVQATTLVYLDGNADVVQRDVSAMDLMMGISLTCQKNSFIYSTIGILSDLGDKSTGEVYTTGHNRLIVAKGDGTFVIS